MAIISKSSKTWDYDWAYISSGYFSLSSTMYSMTLTFDFRPMHRSSAAFDTRPILTYSKFHRFISHTFNQRSQSKISRIISGTKFIRTHRCTYEKWLCHKFICHLQLFTLKHNSRITNDLHCFRQIFDWPNKIRTIIYQHRHCIFVFVFVKHPRSNSINISSKRIIF